MGIRVRCGVRVRFSIVASGWLILLRCRGKSWRPFIIHDRFVGFHFFPSTKLTSRHLINFKSCFFLDFFINLVRVPVPVYRGKRLE